MHIKVPVVLANNSVDYRNDKIIQHALKVSVLKTLKLDTIRKKTEEEEEEGEEEEERKKD